MDFRRMILSALAGAIASILVRTIFYNVGFLNVLSSLILVYVAYGLLGTYFYSIIPCVHGNRKQELIIGLCLGILAASSIIGGMISGGGALQDNAAVKDIIVTVLEITVGFIAVSETYSKL